MRTAFQFCMIFCTQISNSMAKNIKFSTLSKSKMAALFELANFFIFEKLAIYFFIWLPLSMLTQQMLLYFGNYRYIFLVWDFLVQKQDGRHFLSTKWKKFCKNHTYLLIFGYFAEGHSRSLVIFTLPHVLAVILEPTWCQSGT